MVSFQCAFGLYLEINKVIMSPRLGRTSPWALTETMQQLAAFGAEAGRMGAFQGSTDCDFAILQKVERPPLEEAVVYGDLRQAVFLVSCQRNRVSLHLWGLIPVTSDAATAKKAFATVMGGAWAKWYPVEPVDDTFFLEACPDGQFCAVQVGHRIRECG